MVRYSDLIVTVQGDKGIKGIVDLAITYKKPLLPLPFTGGRSEKAWHTHKQSIMQSLGITKDIENLLVTTDLESADQKHMQEIARHIVESLLKPFLAQHKKQCAVIMPISQTRSCTEDEWDYIFRIVKECVESSPFVNECVRCTAPYGKTIIFGILGTLDSADIVIADLTDKNPNVLYELGYRHGRQPNTILIAQRLEDVPFDLRHRNIIIYKWKTDKEQQKLCTKLFDVLKWIENGGQIESPGSDTLGA